jgi:inosose dehydratase
VPHRDRIALNPIQWIATDDGWIDGSLAPDLDFVLDSVAAAGYSAVHVSQTDAALGARFAEAAASHGLALGPGITGTDWYDSADERRRRLEDVRRVGADYAAIGVDVVFTGVNMGPDHPRVAHSAIGHLPDSDRLGRMIDVIGEAAEALAAEGVRPALHPHVGTWVETEAEARAVLDAVPSSILWFGPDIGHLAWAGADPVAFIADYRDRVAGVHLKDYRAGVAAQSRVERRSYRETVLAGLWVEPGRGDADIPGLFELLDGDPSIWWVVEVDSPAAPTPADSIRLCGEWLAATASPEE